MSYEALDAILSVTNTSTNYFKELQQEILNQEFENASDVYTIQEEDLVTGEFKDVKVRLNKGITSGNLQLNTYTKEDFKKILFQDLNHPLQLGQKFKFFNYTWMIVDLNSVASINSVCMVRKCNCKVKFYKDNVLYVLDGIAYDPNRTSDGVDNSSLATSGDSMLDILVKYDSNSKKIKRDMRFIIDRRYWVVSKVDGLNTGLLKIICKENYENSSNDDLINGIADRWSTTNPKPNYSFDIQDLITINKNSSTALSYSIKNNGIEVVNPNIEVTISNTSVATYNSITNIINGLVVGSTTLTLVFHGLDDVDYTLTANIRVVLATSGDISTYKILTNDTSVKGEDLYTVPKFIYKTYYAQKYVNNIVADANYNVGYTLSGCTSNQVNININNCMVEIDNISANTGAINITWTDTVTNIKTIKTINLIS